MEGRLIKSGIYGLLLGLALSIMFVDYKDVTHIGDNGYVTTYKPLIEYIVTILRVSIIGMFLGIFIGWKSYERKEKTQQKNSYYFLFFFIIFLVSCILMYIF